MFTRLDSVTQGGKPSLVNDTILSRASAHECLQLKRQNLRVGGYTKRCLNGSTIPTQGPTPDANLDAMGQNRLASSVRQCFIKASPTVEKAVSCYKVDRLIASLLSFRSVQSSLAVHELLNSLHAEMVCTLPFINAEINFISLKSKWQSLPRKPWVVPEGWFV